jgi:hypothetical protein
VKVTLSMRAHVSIERELTALRGCFRRQGRSVEDLRTLIAVTPEDRDLLEDYILFDPSVTHAVRAALRRREVMLDMLDRQEALRARTAA